MVVNCQRVFRGAGYGMVLGVWSVVCGRMTTKLILRRRLAPEAGDG